MQRSLFHIFLVLVISVGAVTFANHKRSTLPALTNPNSPPMLTVVDESRINGGDGVRLMLVTGTDGQPCSTARGADILTRSLKNKVDYARSVCEPWKIQPDQLITRLMQ